ncbi:hypothetical protein Q5424_27690 [Conexibacter sp. JD483]|uniref:hypothetical protein n=1 Tax=unclassified Conexibacter TaxID=2627773 RepID=UPI00271F4EB4|nr:MULTISPECIES: hypothetical protein [unclassified Conexibacter]MDO8189547.1 hypothetical protein [Conexibacter sp. CPCC 205706]MDO8202107.1 hypothetical protein [Conexibacter sp. CPCC 205762]MDR9372915.1 hypothetical protein [Conexibacter sp. JD483]
MFAAVSGQLKSSGRCIAPLTAVNSYFGFGMVDNRYVFVYSSPRWEGTKEPAALTRCGEVNQAGIGRESGAGAPTTAPPTTDTGETAGDGTMATPQSQCVSNLFIRDGRALRTTRRAGRGISFRITCDNTCRGTFVIARSNGAVVQKRSFPADSKGRSFTVRLPARVDRAMARKRDNALNISVTAGTGRASGKIYFP